LRRIVIILFILTVSYPLYSATNFETGKKYFDQNNFSKAKELFEKDLTEKKSDKRVLSLYYLGRTYEKLGDSDKSIEMYSQVIKEYPDNYLAEHSTNRIKQLNPKKEIDYKKLSSKETPAVQKKDEKKSQGIKNAVQKKSQHQKELMKQSYSYDNILEEKETFRKSSIQNKIKEEIESTYGKKMEAEKTPDKLNPESEKGKKLSASTERKEFIKPDTSIIIAAPAPAIISETDIMQETQVLTEKKPKEPFKYIVKKNDTLFSISNHFYGTGSYFSLLKEYNRLANITSIYEGMELYVPQDPNEISEIPEYVFNKSPQINLPNSAAGPALLKDAADNQEAEKIFDSANEKLKKNLYIDALMDFKNYAVNGKNEIKLEFAYYKIAEINHILGYFNDAAAGYHSYISRFERSANIAAACYNLGNIYSEGLGLYVPAKQYYLLALDKTDDLDLITQIKDIINSLDKNQPDFEKAKIEKEKIDREIKLTEKIMEEKGIIAEIENGAVKKQYKVVQLPSEKEETFQNSRLQTITPDFKHIEPAVQKGRNTSVEQIIEDKKSAQTYNDEGYRFKTIGMYEEAVKNYKQAIDAYPDDPIAYNNLAYLYAELGVNFEEALRYGETAMRLDPNNRGYYLDTIGWIYFKMNDYAKAKELLEKSVFYNPSAIRKYHLAQAYKKLNMKDKALIELQGAQVIQPIGKLADQVKNEIYELQN